MRLALSLLCVRLVRLVRTPERYANPLSGFIPGAAYYLGRFYVRGEMGLRYAILWCSNSIAGAIGGVLALGILELNGRSGLHGWQWLFIIEGLMTCVVALIGMSFLPKDLQSASKNRWSNLFWGKLPGILSEKEATTLVTRVEQDDTTKHTESSRGVQLKDFDCFLSWQLPGHCAMAFLSSVMFMPINTYAPSIIKSLGFQGYTANGLNSVGNVLALFVSIGLAWSSDRFRERGIHILAGFLLSAVGLLWLALAPDGTAKGVLFAAVIVTEGGMGSVQGINAAWLSSKLSERQRPVALAAYAMSIQLAGFVGSNIFLKQDAPRYKKGLLICAGCVLGASAFCILWTILYKWSERHERRTPSVESDPTVEIAGL